jgi:hypothetical protein
MSDRMLLALKKIAGRLTLRSIRAQKTPTPLPESQ